MNDNNGFSRCSASETFRLSLDLEKALEKAAADKHVSKSRVILCCLTGEYNLQRYLSEFTREDILDIHRRELEIFDRTKAKQSSK